MTNFTTWATASMIAALATACTAEVSTGTDGGTGSTATGAGGASSTSTTGSAGSSTTSSGGTSSTGGSAGSSGGSAGSSGASDGGNVCVAKAGDSACRTCALDKCHDEVCGCEGNSACSGHVDEFYDCLSRSTGTLAGCTGDLSIQSNTADGGASWANALGGCMADCEDRCKGLDAGPRR
jgi:hypothetical protein